MVPGSKIPKGPLEDFVILLWPGKKWPFILFDEGGKKGFSAEKKGRVVIRPIKVGGGYMCAAMQGEGRPISVEA